MGAKQSSSAPASVVQIVSKWSGPFNAIWRFACGVYNIGVGIVRWFRGQIKSGAYKFAQGALVVAAAGVALWTSPISAVIAGGLLVGAAIMEYKAEEHQL